MRRSRPGLLLVVFLVLAALTVSPSVLAVEVDRTGTVSRVVDGDTIDVTGVGRIRLADVDAPESGQPGYAEAKNYLTTLVFGKQVYLDVDDVYGTDRYDRWVCVVYVRHNATELINVNEALLERGLVVVKDFDNEFDPTTWTLYVQDPTASTPSENLPGGNSYTPLTNFFVSVALAAAVGAAVAVFAVVVIMMRRGPRR